MKRTVKKVIDGDTFVVNRKIGNSNIVRLANVDAPEKHQFGGSKATNVLKGLIGGQSVNINPVGKSYGRIVANVSRGRNSVNRKMRNKGY